MRTNLELSTVDTVVLLLVALLMIFACKKIWDFFHEDDKYTQ